jgi:asparagine synthase (glutamine-hydrolysing)
MKAICVGSRDRFRVHLPAAGRFLGQSLLDAQDETFLEGITQVPAGHNLVIHLHETRGIRLDRPRPYWNLPRDVMDLTEDQAIEYGRSLFTDAVRLRLRSDVPVGVLLSGGLDSSSIAAMVRRLQPAGQPAFVSAVSDVFEYNEEPFAELTSLHLGNYLHKVRLNPEPESAFAAIEGATWHNDEPIGGFSTVAHHMLMKKARDLGVTVLLSGQGADESLCGYLKYVPFYFQQLARERRVGTLATEALVQLRPPWPFLSEFKLGEAKRYLRPVFRHKHDDILGASFKDRSWELDLSLGRSGLAGRQIADLERFSVPALTHYEDRMSMAASREVRLPFLDHRLVALFVGLPDRFKLRRGWRKWILRQMMSPYLPSQITWRRDKKGFANPVGFWLRDAWRPHVDAIFQEGMVSAKLGLVDLPRLQARYRAYCENKMAGWEASDIFNPLSLEIWARRFSEYIA